MGDVSYKQYTKEENGVYYKAIDTLRASLAAGMKFDEACDGLRVDNEELRMFIVDDFLKICIAEMHYGKGIELVELSKLLGVSEERIQAAKRDMEEDIQNSAISEYHKEVSKAAQTPRGHHGPSGNA
ncbi:MAG: hypothetical protein HQK89_13505 [Nitrospirae bacterium]|nr:hypothetical protein [Nitrospirota bacterium]